MNDGTLNVIPGISRLMASYYLSDKRWRNRMYYIPSNVDYESGSLKINKNEAEITARVCNELYGHIIEDGLVFSDDSIGVITPYRAQISAIKNQLKKYDNHLEEKISVDTVERYQGGSRDIIIMSTCVNFSFQMKTLVSQGIEGKDRKLNVALTRSKELFILIGNRSILEQNETYASLISHSELIEFKEY